MFVISFRSYNDDGDREPQEEKQRGAGEARHFGRRALATIVRLAIGCALLTLPLLVYTQLA